MKWMKSCTYRSTQLRKNHRASPSYVAGGEGHWGFGGGGCRFDAATATTSTCHAGSWGSRPWRSWGGNLKGDPTSSHARKIAPLRTTKKKSLVEPQWAYESWFSWGDKMVSSCWRYRHNFEILCARLIIWQAFSINWRWRQSCRYLPSCANKRSPTFQSKGTMLTLLETCTPRL